MPVFKFKVSWEDDDNISRNIALTNGQSFLQFHHTILQAFEFEDKSGVGNFYESNDKKFLGRAISSAVLANKKDAPALAMVKTPVSALVNLPDKKFMYHYEANKDWEFYVELIGIDRDEENRDYPYVFGIQGISPIKLTANSMGENALMEIEEKYDLGKDDMEDGFGDEGEDDDMNDSDEEESYDEGYGDESDY